VTARNDFIQKIPFLCNPRKYPLLCDENEEAGAGVWTEDGLH
jgi:hypothetical protein